MSRTRDNVTLTERMWAGFEKRPNGCWQWVKAVQSNGYGRVSLGGRMKYPHRVMWELLVGPIPEGLDLDHLCRNRACVNPTHLEPVTRSTNLLRGETLAAAHHEDRDCGFTGCKSCRRFHTNEQAREAS